MSRWCRVCGAKLAARNHKRRTNGYKDRMICQPCFINPSEEDQNNNYGIVFVDDPTTFLSGSNFGRSTGKFNEDSGAIIATGQFIDKIFSSHGGTSTGDSENI